jgi:hypothetical protein
MPGNNDHQVMIWSIVIGVIVGLLAIGGGFVAEYLSSRPDINVAGTSVEGHAFPATATRVTKIGCKTATTIANDGVSPAKLNAVSVWFEYGSFTSATYWINEQNKSGRWGDGTVGALMTKEQAPGLGTEISAAQPRLSLPLMIGPDEVKSFDVRLEYPLDRIDDTDAISEGIQKQLKGKPQPVRVHVTFDFSAGWDDQAFTLGAYGDRNLEGDCWPVQPHDLAEQFQRLVPPAPA